MLKTYIPSESELWEEARRALRKRSAAAAQTHRAAARINHTNDEPAPSPERTARRQRSLQTCHRPAHDLRERKPVPPDTGAYVPESAARIENDPNLTDGARRCARKIMEETYRRNRAGRTLSITVSYLAQALGRCRRTIQRYLRQLEEGGYLSIAVACGERSRLCTGLVIGLLAPLFPRHHRKKWPGKVGNPGATPESQNQTPKILVTRQDWALRCMNGVFRALMKTNPLAGLPRIAAT